MTAPAPAATGPSREQLELAYRQLRQPNHWPKTLDAALADPTFATCLIAMARNLGRPRWAGHAVAPTLPRGTVPPNPIDPTADRQAPPSPITSQWSTRRGVDWSVVRRSGKKAKTPATPAVDLKRRAANDLDD